MTQKALKVSYGEYKYESVPGWAPLPEGWEWNHVVGVAVDSADRIFAYNRSNHPMIVLDKEGNIIDNWGEGQFGSAHHVEIGPDGSVWTTDIGNHTVCKWSITGDLLMTLGTPGKPSIEQSGEPFNKPTDLAFGLDGSIYISDGYGNSRVHHYSPQGKLIRSWGERGTGPGQFMLPHGVAIDPTGLVYVCDRENNRVQIFTSEGQYVSQWKGVHRPNQIVLGKNGEAYIAELGHRQGISANQENDVNVASPNSGVKIMTKTGQWLGGWGSSTLSHGDITAAHAIGIDSEGSLYVGETLDGARMQKFVRI
jgi:DNA-binding beta-propeller fold protein YncE